MTAFSKMYIVCLLLSFFLVACGNGRSAGNAVQTAEATIPPTGISLHTPAVDQPAMPSLTITSSATAAVDTASSITPTVPLHAAFNTQGDIADLLALGFNLFDITGSKTNPASTLVLVNALPEGTQALVWVGNLGNAAKGQSCPAPALVMPSLWLWWMYWLTTPKFLATTYQMNPTLPYVQMPPKTSRPALTISTPMLLDKRRISRF